MDSSTWVAIYLPMIIIFLIILPSQNRRRQLIRFLRKRQINRKAGIKMTSEMIQQYIGKECNITTGTFGTSFAKVKIVEIVDNWMKITGKNQVDLVNIEYIQSIKILPDKKKS